MNGARSVLVDVDDLTVPSNRSGKPQGSAKLRQAQNVARHTEEELGALCRGLNDKIQELGVEIQRANEYHGVEWALHVLGAAGWEWAHNRANAMRHERVQAFNTEDAVKEIGNFVLDTIRQLGKLESEYEQDERQYRAALDEVLAKNAEATPLYLQALDRRKATEATVVTLEGALREAPIAERPAQERRFEAAKRDLDQAKLQEATYLSIVKNAQEALPELRKNLDAAAHAIQALHGMRQSMLEKFADFKVILDRATTAMKARAHIELFESTDPAFNAAIGAITANNVATAGASLEVWTERIKQAAIDPQRSQELLLELLQYVSDATASLAQTEEAVSVGPRKPVLLIEDRQRGKVNIWEDLKDREVVPSHRETAEPHHKSWSKVERNS